MFSVKNALWKKRKMLSLPKVLYIMSVLNSILKYFKNLNSIKNLFIKNADFLRTKILIIVVF